MGKKPQKKRDIIACCKCGEDFPTKSRAHNKLCPRCNSENSHYRGPSPIPMANVVKDLS